MAGEQKNSSNIKRSSTSPKIKKRKHSARNIHTLNVGCSDVPTSLNNAETNYSYDDSSAGKSNVTKILKMIPGFCHVKKCTSANVIKPTMDYHVTATSKDLSGLIDVSPPNDVIEHKKSANSPKSHGDALKGRQHKSEHGNRRKESKIKPKCRDRNRPRLELNRICLNVKVSGPIYDTLGQVLSNNIKHVVTLAGAGISTSAGIPDFRSPDSGLYNELKKYDLPYAQAVFEKKFFDKNPKPLYALLKETLVNEYKPTIAHYFVTLLEEKGLLLRHFTQNVDGLERLAGISDDKLVEAHGTVYVSRCIKCKTEYGLLWLRDQLIIQGKSVPYCQDPQCLGIVKPNIVLFGETLDTRFTKRVSSDLPQSDLLIIMGTSLVVEPFASAVKKASSICPRIIINNVPVGEHLGIAYDGSKCAEKMKKKGNWRDIFIQGSCDEGVLHLAKLFKWEDELEALIKRCEPFSTVDSPSASVAHGSKAIQYPKKTEMFRKNPQNDDKCPEKKACIDKMITPAPAIQIETDPATPLSRNAWQQFKSRVRNIKNPLR